MHAGERGVRADLGADRGKLGQAHRGIDRIGGARPAAAKLDDGEPDRAHVDPDHEAMCLRQRVDEHRRPRQSHVRA